MGPPGPAPATGPGSQAPPSRGPDVRRRLLPGPRRSPDAPQSASGRVRRQARTPLLVHTGSRALQGRGGSRGACQRRPETGTQGGDRLPVSLDRAARHATGDSCSAPGRPVGGPRPGPSPFLAQLSPGEVGPREPRRESPASRSETRALLPALPTLQRACGHLPGRSEEEPGAAACRLPPLAGTDTRPEDEDEDEDEDSSARPLCALVGLPAGPGAAVVQSSSPASAALGAQDGATKGRCPGVERCVPQCRGVGTEIPFLRRPLASRFPGDVPHPSWPGLGGDFPMVLLVAVDLVSELAWQCRWILLALALLVLASPVGQLLEGSECGRFPPHTHCRSHMAFFPRLHSGSSTVPSAYIGYNPGKQRGSGYRWSLLRDTRHQEGYLKIQQPALDPRFCPAGALVSLINPHKNNSHSQWKQDFIPLGWERGLAGGCTWDPHLIPLHKPKKTGSATKWLPLPK